MSNDSKDFFFIFRFNATDDDIRRAYRKIVLKHHPDKRKAQGEEIRQEDDYFTCITKAYETLGKRILALNYLLLLLLLAGCDCVGDLLISIFFRFAIGNPTKRRSYDSIDPEFDDSLPSSSEIEKRFYETFSKYFKLNARWSEKKNVPVIGKLSFCANGIRCEYKRLNEIFYLSQVMQTLLDRTSTISTTSGTTLIRGGSTATWMRRIRTRDKIAKSVDG